MQKKGWRAYRRRTLPSLRHIALFPRFLSLIASCISVAVSSPVFAQDTIATAYRFSPIPVIDQISPTLYDTVAPSTLTQWEYRRPVALALTGGLYAYLYGYTYQVWHQDKGSNNHFQFREEGWLSSDTYAGGADKIGHLWSNYALTRGVSGILQWGGYSHRAALASSVGLTAMLFLINEIQDGYTPRYGFSWNDVLFNLAGNAIAVLFELNPRLDEMFDFRITYFPSKAFLDQQSEGKDRYNFAEDYTGQTYLLAFHLVSLKAIRDDRWFGWTQYIDLVLGFRAENYMPYDSKDSRRQVLFLGLSLNLQRVFDQFFTPRKDSGEPPRSSSTIGSLLHFITEIYSPPYTTLELLTLSRDTP